jgi:hypothetical protein
VLIGKRLMLYLSVPYAPMLAPYLTTFPAKSYLAQVIPTG